MILRCTPVLTCLFKQYRLNCNNVCYCSVTDKTCTVFSSQHEQAVGNLARHSGRTDANIGKLEKRKKGG